MTVPFIQHTSSSSLFPFRFLGPSLFTRRPSLQSTYKPSSVLVCLLALIVGHFSGLSFPFTPTLLHAKELDFGQFLETAKPKITDITSNEQAQGFINKIIGPFIPASQNGNPRIRRPKGQQLPPSISEKMVSLGKEISKWNFSYEFEKQLDKDIGSIPDTNLVFSNAHLSWVKESSPQSEFLRVLGISETYVDLAKIPVTIFEEPPHFASYALGISQTYTSWTKDNQGLLTIAEKEGAQGITQRLEAYWDKNVSPLLEPSLTPERRASYVARYLHLHFLPYMQIYLQKALLKQQLESKYQARALWGELRQWQIDQKQVKGLMRLCGTWQWLIHNHQNHGDHKTVMVYPPPSQFDRLDPKPAKIQVQGNTVYIRWEFPRGIIQEESLLFSENDRALSGTFVNNMGPLGNITARRVKPCPKN